VLFIKRLAALDTNAGLVSVFKDIPFAPHRLIALGTEQHYVGTVYWGLFFLNTAGLIAPRTGMPFNYVQTFNEHTVLLAEDTQNFTGLFTIFSGDHHDRVAFFYSQLIALHLLFSPKEI
jgi:hypothetical protein